MTNEYGLAVSYIQSIITTFLTFVKVIIVRIHNSFEFNVKSFFNYLNLGVHDPLWHWIAKYLNLVLENIMVHLNDSIQFNYRFCENVILF